MTDKLTQPDLPEKISPTTTPSPSEETKKGTQPLNQKPVSKIDPETQERLQKMLSSRKQASDATSIAEKTKPVPITSVAPPDDKKAQSAATSADTTPVPTKPDAAPGAKNPAWPVPAKSLGAPATPTKPETAPPASPPDATRPSVSTAQLNKPLAEPPLVSRPLEIVPEPAVRSKAEAQTAIRTTNATRNVPKGRVAQEVWKVIFQGVVGSEGKELAIEVKGLSVVGRADPDGESRADLDLSPFNAGAFGVSRQHVILIPTDEGPCIIDMNSTNGTWINGLYLEPGRRYRLRTNDRVELGTLKLLVRVMTPAEQSPPPDSSGSQAATATLNKPGAR